MTGMGEPVGAVVPKLPPLIQRHNDNWFCFESCESQLRMYNVVGRMLAKLKAQYLTGRHEAMLDLEGIFRGDVL